MDWLLYDNRLRHEKINKTKWSESAQKSQNKVKNPK